MRTIHVARPLVVLAIVLLLGSLTASLALAHERRDVGAYRFTVGFFVEPALEAIPNAVSVRVVKPAGDTTTPVPGVEKTLKVEITHVPTGKSKTMDLRAVFGDAGHYRADLIPTLSGQYVFRFFGKVEDLEVSERFESGPGRFNDVQPQSDTQFPESVGSAREIQAASRGANATANDASDKASAASTLAIVGVALGAVGIVVGGAGIAVAVRRKGKS
jgi:hypothetical protein